MGNGYCFVCGRKNDVGLKIDFKMDKGKQCATCQTVLSGDYRGWTGFVHGGILASLLDGAMVYACKTIDLACMTAELNIKYKKPVPLNTVINIIARVKKTVQRLSYTVVYTEALLEIEGKPACRAEAKMFAESKTVSFEQV